VSRAQTVLVAAAVGLLGCGRLGFEASTDRRATDGAVADSAVADGLVPDGAQSDLVFRVKFEGDGFDVMGGRSPSCLGCPLQFAPSPSTLGQALRLTGTECLEYADDLSLRPAVFTLSAWIRMSQSRVSSVLGKAFNATTTEGNSYEFWVTDNSYVHFSTVNGGDPYVWHMGVVPLSWYHVVGTFDGVTKRIYVDGVERMTNVVAATSYDAEPLRIGCDRGMGAIGNFFIGDIDDVRLYRRALTPAEFASLAAQLP